MDKLDGMIGKNRSGEGGEEKLPTPFLKLNAKEQSAIRQALLLLRRDYPEREYVLTDEGIKRIK